MISKIDGRLRIGTILLLTGLVMLSCIGLYLLRTTRRHGPIVRGMQATKAIVKSGVIASAAKGIVVGQKATALAGTPLELAPVDAVPPIKGEKAAERPVRLNQIPALALAPSQTSENDSAFSPSAEVGTLMMYQAHASLRTSEVADPNSEANRRILAAMVAKMINKAKAAPAR
jgi:hypothetical protein